MFNITEENTNKISGSSMDIWCVLYRTELLEQAWDCPPLKGLLLWGYPLAGIWELKFPNKNGSLSLNCLCKQYGLCCTHTFLLSPEVSAPSREDQCDQLPIKNTEHRLLSFPGRYFTFIVNLIARFGRRLLEVCSWFPLNYAVCAFSPCWFCFISLHFNKSQP